MNTPRTTTITIAPHAATEMMEIENLIRYTERAVGLKPSAMQGEARLRGLHRIIYSKTIISVYTLPEAGASCDAADRNDVNVSEKCCNSCVLCRHRRSRQQSCHTLNQPVQIERFFNIIDATNRLC